MITFLFFPTFPQTNKRKPAADLSKQDFTDPNFLLVTNPHWIEAGLHPGIIDILSGKGITKFTPVQGEAYGPIVAGRDVIGRSRTGTGKTLAFGLPAMTRIVQIAEETGKKDLSTGVMRRGRLPSMIILCPTRELARQVQEELAIMAKPLGLFAEIFHGGVSYDPQARALRNGVDIIVGTPGRVIDHLERGNMDLSECNVAVLDEADEMLNMGFADDVETILDGIGSRNKDKTQVLLFSATTPDWVKKIGDRYQKNVKSIDATTEVGGARTATTVRHMAVQLPPGMDSKMSILEDIIAVEISREKTDDENSKVDIHLENNPIAKAAAERKRKTSGAMQQKIFGKTIVFTETKRQADELVSGTIFKSLTAQALHGDIGQKQRDSTLAAFRAGAFNVLVATDVAARGIDIQDVDLVIQFDPPRDVDTYVHRSGRTGRAGNKGVSILLFSPGQSRDIVRIERDLGHGFKFELAGPPSTEAALRAAATTSAIACKQIPNETAEFFKDAAVKLLETEDPADIVARCLAAISKRTASVQTRSLLTGELGITTVRMSSTSGRPLAARDLMFTVGKLSRLSNKDGEEETEESFDSRVGKIQVNAETGDVVFDMDFDEAKKMIAFSQTVDTGAEFEILKELEVERGSDFGRGYESSRGGGGRGGGSYGGGRGGGRGGGSSSYGGGRGGGSSSYGGGRGGGSSSYGGERGGSSSAGGYSSRGASGEGRRTPYNAGASTGSSYGQGRSSSGGAGRGGGGGASRNRYEGGADDSW